MPQILPMTPSRGRPIFQYPTLIPRDGAAHPHAIGLFSHHPRPLHHNPILEQRSITRIRVESNDPFPLYSPPADSVSHSSDYFRFLSPILPFACHLHFIFQCVAIATRSRLPTG